MRKAVLLIALGLAAAAVVRPAAQLTQLQSLPDDVLVRPIEPPAVPLPPESNTARIKKFTFFAYGDTRSAGPTRAGEPAQDGLVLQAAHGEIVDAMVATARRLASTDAPVRFV